MPKVAIIYLCHGNLRHLPEVVLSLSRLNYPREDLVVYMVPNGSADGIADEIRKSVLPRSEKDLPKIVLLDDGINHGFAGGNNLAIRQALEANVDFVFLHNGDLKLDPEAISAAVRLAESDQKIGSVQSLIFYWKNPDVINTSGGMIHVAGYGYARDNLKKINQIKLGDGEEIAYASGAAVLYRACALKKVGLLEEGFFMYHEDLELGLRLKIAGYKNVLSIQSKAFHDYSFNSNPKKIAWMELYRWVVMISYYRIATWLVIGPLILLIELGSWLMALKGGWLKAKFWAAKELLKSGTWELIFKLRTRQQQLREIPDREWLQLVTGRIEAQEEENFILEKLANPTINFIWNKLRTLILW